MNKLATFFRTLVKSSTDPQYGNEIVKAPSWFSWKYFLILTLLTTLVTAAKVLIPISLFDASQAIHKVGEAYPAELQVTGDETGLHINQPLPYAIPLPEEVRAEEVTPRNLVTFTSDQWLTGPDSVNEYDSWIVVTESSTYVKEDFKTGELKVYEAPTFDQSFIVDRSVVDNLVTSIAENPVIKQRLYIPLIALGLLLFLYPLLLAGRLIAIAIYSLIVLVLANMFMKGRGVSYSKTFQLGLHTITPVIIAAYILDALGYTFMHGIIYFIAFAAWTLFMISEFGTSAKQAVSAVTTKRTVKPSSKTKRASRRK